MAPPSHPPDPVPGASASDASSRPKRSWGLILLGVLAFLLALGGLALSVVPCVTVVSLYLTVPAFAFGALLLVVALWRRSSKILPVLTLMLSGLGLGLGWRTYSEAMDEKPTITEMLERNERSGGVGQSVEPPPAPPR